MAFAFAGSAGDCFAGAGRAFSFRDRSFRRGLNRSSLLVDRRVEPLRERLRSLGHVDKVALQGTGFVDPLAKGVGKFASGSFDRQESGLR